MSLVSTEWSGVHVVIDGQWIFVVFAPSGFVRLDIDRQRCSVAGLEVVLPLVDLDSSFFDSTAYSGRFEPKDDHLVVVGDRETGSIDHHRHSLALRRRHRTDMLDWIVAIRFDHFEETADYIPERLLNVPTQVFGPGYAEIQ